MKPKLSEQKEACGGAKSKLVDDMCDMKIKC